jgi:hypothetical protein
LKVLQRKTFKKPLGSIDRKALWKHSGQFCKC